MSKEITLTIPDDVYKQATEVARTTRQPVAMVLTDALKSLFLPFPLDERHKEMAKEVEAYEKKHDQLVKQYLGQYVAMYQGNIIDYDQDVVTLSKRMAQQLPSETVLIRRVEQQKECILTMRSPRFL